MAKIGLETIFKLSLFVNMVDNLTGPSRQVDESLDDTTKKLNNMQQNFASMAKQGAAISTAGAQMTKKVLEPVEATFDTQKALGEVASLGLKDLKTLEKAATDFSNTWSGTTKDEFISAAYSIKSGIASLSDEGVAEYTKIAALTAKATKASTDEMTSLFATGYGIYKDFYSDLSDLEFAEMFSSGISKSVQQFETDGSEMAGAIERLGASATSAQVPLEEQLSVLGMLQATMSGSEAGTMYNAFLKTAAKAGEELGLKFTDANNQLLSMPEILDLLRGKYGDTIDAVEKMEIQKAFGTVEAVKLIDQFYNKTDDLQENIMDLYGVMGEGTKYATDMADAMNQDPGARYELLKQQVQNLKEEIGLALLPTVGKLLEKGSEYVMKITTWVQEHEKLVEVLMKVALVIGVAITGFGGFLAVFGVGGMVITSGISNFLKFGGVLKKVVSGVWSFTAALLSNPMTWVIAGVIALAAGIYLLWKNFDKVSSFISGVFYGVVEGLGNIFRGLGNIFSDTIANMREAVHEKLHLFKDSGKRIMETMAEGIKSAVMAPVNAVKSGLGKIRNMLPFSDAKEGPLSELTLSGRKVFETLSMGMNMEAPILKRTTELAFAGIPNAISSIPNTNNKNLGKIDLQQRKYEKINLREVIKESATENKERIYYNDKDRVLKIEHFEVKVEQIKELSDLLNIIKDFEDYTESNGDD